VPLTSPDLPDEVADLIGRRRHVDRATFRAERSHGTNLCAAVQNGNPLFWDDELADELTDGPILPPTTLSLWSRPDSWSPEAGAGAVPLRTHFELKELLGLPDALISASELTLADPVRPGDLMLMGESLRSVSEEKQTAHGTGRFWTIDVHYANQCEVEVGVETVTGFGYRSDREPVSRSSIPAPVVAEPSAPRGPTDDRRRLLLGEVVVGQRIPDVVHEVTRSTVVLGAMAARDWAPMHHDPAVARARSGVADIFLDTPTQLAWIERLLTDWTGPTGRLGRIALRMGVPVVAGDTMTLSADVTAAGADRTGCGWVSLVVRITVRGEVASTASARIAVPIDAGDNPWVRRGADWLP
jgi:acyl dehydratase